MTKAEIIFEDKQLRSDGTIVQMRILSVPNSVRGSAHKLKYSLFYGRPGLRIVAYDNEAGKGDHKHIREVETPYQFTTVEKLIADFILDVRNEGGI